MRALVKIAAGIAVAGGVSLSSGAAVAQEAAPAKSAAAATDVVRLKNGGLLRGSISELVPGDSVTIITLTGDARKFPMTEVSYAGAADDDHGVASIAPAAPAPGPAPAAQPRPYITVEGPAAHLHLVSDPSGLVFARESVSVRGIHGYDRLCTSPCDITLPAGTETFAVGPADARPYEVESVSFPAGSSEIRAEYQSRQPIRTTGWIVMGAGLLGGVALLAVSNDEKAVKAAAWVVGLGGLGVGIGLVLVSDKTTVERVPGSSAPNAEKHAGLIPALQGTF